MAFALQGLDRPLTEEMQLGMLEFQFVVYECKRPDAAGQHMLKNLEEYHEWSSSGEA